MMNLHEQNARVIDAAADRIFKRGWFRLGWFGYPPPNAPGSECAVLALNMAALDMSTPNTSPSVFLPAMMVVAEAVGGDIPTWNDEQPDADTVIAKLRECADAERAKAWDLVPA